MDIKITKKADIESKIIYADAGYVGTEKFVPKNVEKRYVLKDTGTRN